MSGREELTAESEALLDDFDRVGTNSHRLRDHLAAIEAAAVTRHVRETGREGLRVERLAAAVETAYDVASERAKHLGSDPFDVYTHPYLQAEDILAALAAREEDPK